MYNKIIISIFLLSDIIAGLIAYTIVLNPLFFSAFQLKSSFWFLQVFWMSLFYLTNLYNPKATLSRFEEILRLVPLIYFSLVLFITADLFELIKLKTNYKELLYYGLVLAIITLINRTIIHSFQKIMLSKGIGLSKTLIFGLNRRGIDTYNSLKNHSVHGIDVIGFIQANNDPINFKVDYSLPIYKEEFGLNQIIKKTEATDIIIALDQPNPAQIINSIATINGDVQSLKILPDMYDVVTGMARTNQLVGVPLIDINLNIDTFYSKRLKILFDKIFAIFGIIVIIPIWILIGLAIKINSKGPIIYKQVRCGEKGKIFNIYKFRSMVSNAEEDTGPVWADIKDDRITKIGRILRRLHLDETPQLINIIKGEMSFVGPRPERPYFVKKLKNEYPFYERRLKIRPGISGWAQIKQPFDTTIKDVHQKLKYDFFYIENISFLLDTKIFIQTLRIVTRGHPR